MDVEKIQKIYREARFLTELLFLVIFMSVMFILAGYEINVIVFYIIIIFSACLCGYAGIAIVYQRYTYAKWLKEKTPMVLETIERYKKGDMTMLEAIAESKISFKGYMRILKMNDIEVEFNDSIFAK